MASNQNLPVQVIAPADEETLDQQPEQANAPQAENPEQAAPNAGSTVVILKDPAPPVVRFKPTPLPKYDGNTKEYPCWRKTVLTIFQMDWHAFGYTDLRAFLMIFMSLRGKARETSAAFYEKGGVNGTNRPEDFIAYLDRCNLDVTRRDKAFGELMSSIKMREGEEWLSFFPIWINKCIEACANDFPGSYKIFTLQRSLTSDLQRRIAGMLLPQEDFEEWVETVGSFAQRVEEMLLSFRRRDEEEENARRAEAEPAGQRATAQGSGRQCRAAAPQANQGQANQGQANATANTAAPSATNATNVVGGARRTGGERRRSEWKTPEQIARLQEQGRCFRCERKRCNTRVCPMLPAQNPGAPIVRVVGAPLPRAGTAINLNDTE
ncbi:hypothetical protein K3495_g2351 [Podosphaera aphanis]|nr:hypothetical protein K3495_g2351 [Podosphaera aphanis]